MDIKKIKNDFPVLVENDISYLDSAASTIKPRNVIDAINYYYEKLGVNVHRGVYKLSYDATERYELSRQRVADFINCKFDEVVFTRGASNALNLVANSYGMANIEEGDEIIVSELEHHSSMLPWQHVAKEKNANLVYVPLSDEGRITVENFKKVLTEKTKVVALTYVSNVMGYITPIEEIIELAHEVGAIVTVDGAQAVPHMKVDVKALNCDFLSFSGHKMVGPTGIGVLYGKFELLQDMNPVEFGGDMIDYVYLHDATWKDAPYKFETGTPLIAGAIGLHAAIDYIESIGYDQIIQHEHKLKNYAIEQFHKIDGVTVFNETSDTGIISFNIDNVHPHDAASVFDQEGVCIRAGHHCAQPLMKYLNQIATLRASFYFYNDKKDVDRLVNAVKKAKEFFAFFE
ncbi:aminotransferase class V-fold PLP-dependent enzyme [Haloplasma contractile]|uniref:Cysteine desulfurase n=1 Tax=Haloplasma contractile SSD-17B TaxID=1033810 RepID=U2EFA0_9MOLU|nr:selenocysteine lyase protein [Haloplasma contractile SSD-17B]